MTTATSDPNLDVDNDVDDDCGQQVSRIDDESRSAFTAPFFCCGRVECSYLVLLNIKFASSQPLFDKDN